MSKFYYSIDEAYENRSIGDGHLNYFCHWAGLESSGYASITFMSKEFETFEECKSAALDDIDKSVTFKKIDCGDGTVTLVGCSYEIMKCENDDVEEVESYTLIPMALMD